MKIQLLQDVKIGKRGKLYLAGRIIEVISEIGDELVRRGKAYAFNATTEKKIEIEYKPSVTKDTPAKKKKVSTPKK